MHTDEPMYTDEPMQAIEKAKKIAECLDNKKGRRITVLEVGELTSISDYFVIASGGSAAQVKAMADEVEEKLREAGYTPVHMEGYQVATWILLDYSDVVVHIFLEETREFYDIERLWTDAKKIELNFSADA